jgi:hypothetical protein
LSAAEYHATDEDDEHYKAGGREVGVPVVDELSFCIDAEVEYGSERYREPDERSDDGTAFARNTNGKHGGDYHDDKDEGREQELAADGGVSPS